MECDICGNKELSYFVIQDGVLVYALCEECKKEGIIHEQTHKLIDKISKKFGLCDGTEEFDEIETMSYLYNKIMKFYYKTEKKVNKQS